MTTMLEKMQAAICCYDGCRHSDTCGAHGYEVKARAVLDAMKTPTPEIMNAVGPMNNYDFAAEMKPDADHIEWWQAMIQAIKEEADD